MEKRKFNVGDRVMSLVEVAGTVVPGSPGTVIQVGSFEPWYSVIFDTETNSRSAEWEANPPRTPTDAYVYGAWDMREIELELFYV